jgi:putative salt-induced outer membrane protein YdiY
MSWRSVVRAALAAQVVLVPAASVAEEEELGWSAKAELSYVRASGNAKVDTLGLKGTAIHEWARSSLALKANGLRAESSEILRVAVGDPESFVLSEESFSQLTAENYLLSGTLDRKVSERFFWKAGASWERNRFKGIENRYLGLLGLGHTWLDRERLKLKTGYSVTLTRQEDVSPEPDADPSFVGAQFKWDFSWRFSGSATFQSELALDANLEQTRDFRVDTTNSVSVTMTKRLALKVSLQWLYQNAPALTSVPLEDPAGVDTGQDVLVPLEKLDTAFTTSIVVDF